VILSDEIRKLVVRCLAGEQSATIELVNRFKGPVFGLCFRMLGQWQDAEDIAQETFTRAFKSLHQWDSTRDFSPWLMAIAGNRCRTMLSKRKRRPATSDLVEHLPDDSPDQQAAEHLAEEVQLALGTVRLEYRQAFVLFHEHEMSYAEIAETLACPLGTVKTWVHRARKELIEQLRQRGVVEQSTHAMRNV